MADVISASPNRSAILFGPERSGLETDEVALANAIVTVPINPEFASLNLAQAVILLAYEWSKRGELAQPPAKELEPPATHGELDGLIKQLDEELVAKGYFHPPSRTQATRNTIRTIFTKTGWSSREVKAVRGIDGVERVALGEEVLERPGHWVGDSARGAVRRVEPRVWPLA